MKSTRIATMPKADKTYVKKPQLINTPKVKYGEERRRYLSAPVKTKKGK